MNISEVLPMLIMVHLGTARPQFSSMAFGICASFQILLFGGEGSCSIWHQGAYYRGLFIVSH